MGRRAGFRHSPETREKMREAAKGRPKSAAHRQRLAEVARIDGPRWSSEGRAQCTDRTTLG